MLFALTVSKHRHKCEVCMLYVYIRQAVSGVVEGMSVRAAAAGMIAADFSAVHTDSPLQRSGGQRLPAAAQRF